MGKVLLKPADSDQASAFEFQRSGERFTAHVGGHSLEGLLEQAPGGGLLLRLGHRVIPCHVLRKDRQIEVWLGGDIHRFDIVGGKAPRLGAHAGPVAREIAAPMPGTILRILVSPGDLFSAHQPLIIMESMKMEMTLSAPHAGRVRKQFCAAGELVPMGKVLLELDPEESHAEVSG